MSGSSAAAVSEIPLIAGAQTLSITLNSTLYALNVYWNPPSATWLLDIALASSGAPLIQGIALVTGENLLEQYAYLGIGVALWVVSDISADALPTFTNLGQQSHLYFWVDGSFSG